MARASGAVRIHWMQVRPFKPSTACRQFSAAVDLPACLNDGALEHSPGRAGAPPHGPRQDANLGVIHLQFEGLRTAVRTSSSFCGLVLVAMLGLLGLRIRALPTAWLADLRGHRANIDFCVHPRGAVPA
jgi:hypothetical protein